MLLSEPLLRGVDNHLYPLMISTTFVQSSLTSTSFPTSSRKSCCLPHSNDHLSSNSLSSSFQSAYRIFHSTETTLLKIHNDLSPCDGHRGEVTSLILLDLSAAFDTVDHSSGWLTRLQNWFGLDGLSLAWFTSYLSSRSQAVSINDSNLCDSTSLSWWCTPTVPYCGPLTFYSLYYSSLLGWSQYQDSQQISSVCQDDTQLYISSFTPTNSALISWRHLPPLVK